MSSFATALSLLLLTSPAQPFQPALPHQVPPTQTKTALSNILRDYAAFSSSPWDDPSLPSQSTDWRKNAGYSSSPPPLPLGGSMSPYGVRKEMETNPYYDAGWAQSVRRDDPNNKRWSEAGSNYNGYNDPYDYTNRYYNNPSTYPGMSSPDRSLKYYTNPTNPYYDPLWSQSYTDRRAPSNLRQEDFLMGDGYYNNEYGYGMGGYGPPPPPPPPSNYWGGNNGGYYGYGRGMGPGRRMYAVSPEGMGGTSLNSRGVNQNRFMGANRGSTLSNRSMSRKNNPITSLRMSYYDPEWGGPPFDPRMPPPPMPPYYGGMGGPRVGPGRMMPRGRPLSELADNANRYNNVDNRFRRNLGGNPGPGGRMDGPPPYGVPPPFGRDNAPARTSLKDMAARTATSFDAQIINSMNNRPNARAGSPAALPETSGGFGSASSQRGASTGASTSTSSQYVPLNAVSADRAPPLTVSPPTPPPFASSNPMMPELPATIHVSRIVRPSVVLVTSKGVGNANSQGSGFVVAFDEDSALDVDTDEMKDQCHILTSAHVAPPGWKVSVTFPNDPDKEYSATVVGRKLNSDLALLRVETSVDESDEYPFPPPLILSNEDVVTSMYSNTGSERPPLSEIGSPVYSFGYPMGVEGPTMTSGILSATTNGINYMDAPTGEEGTEKSRPFEKTSFVITDAAMAGGMSGGPLVNYNGIVVGVNALVRPDLRALGNYAVSSLECEEFLEKLEDQNSNDGRRTSVKVNSVRSIDGNAEAKRKKRVPQTETVATANDVAGFRVMLYGYSTSKADATKILRRVAGLDENRAESAMRAAYSFGAGVVDEFYVAGSGGRERGIKAARKSADDLQEKLKGEGLLVEVEPVHLLN
ncbi:hypothetical protein HJC23_012528 [Cyclotella cryptica]|uniref:SPOR domain-containing protein n=1 Tax=Cyclotella cryptica TaxID=29204 RepID=A0ABD3QPZ8_9STRA|eukprot:CCRYP_003140-RA/>CCRYP_003140-RA protein AED:0.04 eAED:0.04 QI:236/1/1/1/1/1/3/2540/863